VRVNYRKAGEYGIKGALLRNNGIGNRRCRKAVVMQNSCPCTPPPKKKKQDGKQE